MTISNAKELLRQNAVMMESVIELTEHMSRVMSNQNALNKMVEVLAERLTELEARQDLAKHNEILEDFDGTRI